MYKAVFLIIGFIGFSNLSISSIEDLERERMITVKTQRLVLDRAAKKADEIDSLKWGPSTRSHPSKEAALEFILSQYPPPPGGLYWQYQSQVNAKIKRWISFSKASSNSWYVPWDRMAADILGGCFPLSKIGPSIIALVEIRRIPEYYPFYELFLRMREVHPDLILTEGVSKLEISERTALGTLTNFSI